MKAIKLTIAALVLAGTASFALAGPGPQYWIKQSAPKPAATAPATTPVATATTPAAAQPAPCACCTTGTGCSMHHG